jgi:hypothetical protein
LEPAALAEYNAGSRLDPRMICPYCQHEIDVGTLACPRCFAEYPRRGMPFGFGLRKAVVSSVMMLVFSILLVQCVFNYLPGGPESGIPTGSAQLPIQPLPDLKGYDVQQQLARWANQQQNGGQTIPPMHK